MVPIHLLLLVPLISQVHFPQVGMLLSTDLIPTNTMAKDPGRHWRKWSPKLVVSVDVIYLFEISVEVPLHYGKPCISYGVLMAFQFATVVLRSTTVTMSVHVMSLPNIWNTSKHHARWEVPHKSQKWIYKIKTLLIDKFSVSNVAFNVTQIHLVDLAVTLKC